MSRRKNISLPNFLIVGTAKAGTTSIYRYLKQHPDVSIPVKETFFFLNPIYRKNTLDYPKQRRPENLVLDAEVYNGLYAGLASEIVAEIGTGYLYHHEVAIPLIKEHLGEDVKICIVLRDPVQRTYSSFKHFAKDLHDKGSFSDSLAAEKARVLADWDFMWHHTAMSMYARQVKAFIEEFPNVKVCFYEDLDRDAEKFMEEIYDFIGIHSPNNIDYKAKFNISGNVRSKWLQESITQESRFKRLFRPIFRALFGKERRAAIRKYVKSKNMRSANEMSADDKAFLTNYFANDIAELDRIIDRNLPWEGAPQKKAVVNV